jgi:hypothetical protein
VKRTTLLVLALVALLRPAVLAEVRGVPLPPAPVRVVVPDVAAFDSALTGAYRRAFLGAPEEDDPVTTAFRRTQVGSKLEDQWTKLASDLPWSWGDVLKLKPRTLGLSLLSVGSLEAVFVIDLPLATAAPLPAGTAKRTPTGAPYTLVTRGAGDAAEGDRRMGLAWAKAGGWLFLATSEKALLSALEEAQAGRAWTPPLPGIVAMELDTAALEKDRYFKREFLFGPPREGRVAAALRLEGGRLVEVREGRGEGKGPALVFDTPGAVSAAWEDDGASLWPALRAALIEPRPDLSATPVAPLRPLPGAGAERGEDRYLVDILKPPAGPDAAWEEGDLRLWRELRARHPLSGWGHRLGADGARVLVFAWPNELMEDLRRACRATLERRGGRVSEHDVGETHELRLGPGLPALAWRRVQDLVWIGPSAAALAHPPAARRDEEIVRWARLDLGSVRKDAARWARVEGPANPETVRPFSDRILGILGWMPSVRSLTLERRQGPAGWTERVEFGAQAPP